MTDKTVTVYGKDGCAPCKYVKARLEQEGINFTFKDATKGDGAREFSQFGVNSVPVVTFGEHTIFDSKQIGEVVQWWNDNE